MINSKFLLASEKLIDKYLFDIDLNEDFFIDEFSIFEILEFLKSLGILDDDSKVCFNFKFSVAQQILLEYLKVNEFSWLNRCFNGRKVLFDSLDNNSLTALKFKSCINEAGVGLDDHSSDTLRWWNELYNFFRNKHDLKISSHGLDYEVKTKEYEDFRVQGETEIVSVNDNGAGYDLLSWTDHNKEDYLCIEVKSSIQDLSTAEAHISRKQWNTANNLGENFMFYFWCQDSLAKLSVDELRSHVPVNSNDGMWEKFIVPMSTFSSHFEKIVMNFGSSD